MAQVTFDELVQRVRSGNDFASFPTDTVPALAAPPDAAHLIFTAKQRQLDKPLILMAGQAEDVWSYVSGTTAEFALWQQIVDQYWPGALTLVLPASDRVPAAMNPTDPSTIGVRVPNHALARKILRQTGPLATTSANLSGQPPLLTLTEIETQFPQVLTLSGAEIAALMPDQSDLLTAASGMPSTVARWNGSGWNILRQGAILLP